MFRLGIKVMIGQESSASREVTNTRTLSGGPTPALSPSSQHTHALARRVVPYPCAFDAGEKSFTTLALLLALGGVTQVPFAMFDEIVRTDTTPRPPLASLAPTALWAEGCRCVGAQDVFMDDVNRKITLRTLYEEAKTMAGRRQVRHLSQPVPPAQGPAAAFWTGLRTAAAEADRAAGLRSTAC